MARRSRLPRTLLVLLASTSGLIGGVEAQGGDEVSCYDSWGRVDDSQRPCFGSDNADRNSTTFCCNKEDSCLSNGLCWGPASGNLMTQQGCTDKSWKGCTKFCREGRQPGVGFVNDIPIFPCSGSSTSGGDVRYCCGPDTSACCANSSAWMSIPQGTIVVPAETPTPSSASGTPASTSAVPTDSTQAPANQGDGTSGVPQPEAASGPSDALKVGLGVGLGIGLPILIVLIVVAYLLSRHPPPPPRSPFDSSQRAFSFRGKLGSGGGASALGLAGIISSTSRRGGTGGRGGRGAEGDDDDDNSRRDSFGRVDTNVGPPSDDGIDPWAARSPDEAAWRAWPPNAGTGWPAAAIAAWAEQPPPSPKEMDGRGLEGEIGVDGEKFELPDKDVVTPGGRIDAKELPAGNEEGLELEHVERKPRPPTSEGGGGGNGEVAPPPSSPNDRLKGDGKAWI